MGCVNRSSKEFKDLAQKHNVSSNKLELITHKYWLETGNETLFPTDVYIQAQLGNTSYHEPGQAVRKLWQQRYSSAKTFSSMQELKKAKREAAKYFPSAAIVSYKDANNHYVLSIKRPVEKVSHDKDAFFKDYDSAGSFKDAKALNLDIKESQPYGIGKVQELYNKFNTDRTTRDLADRAFKIADELGLQIIFDETLPFGTVGRYTNDNTIRFKKSFLERDMMNNKKAPIMLHEVLHALSMYALSNQTKNWKRPEALEAFRTEMNSLYQDLKSNPMLKGERGIVDLHEFVAELANPVFREKIKNIDRENNAAKKIEKKSFWSRVIDAFKKLLGLHVTNTYYQRSMNALDKALDAFDIDTYMRYNGVKNQLRQGYNAKEWEFNSMSDTELKTKVSNYFDSQVYDEELLSLKKKAIENGTFMKAPNGKPTKLTERQWLQVRTKAFKEWFGDWENNPSEASKVVDENGEPLVVYHGSTAKFNTFDKSKNKKGQWKNVDGSYIDFDTNNTFFFSSNKAVAKSYALLNKLTGEQIANSGIKTINRYLEGIKYLNRLTSNDAIEKYVEDIDDAIGDISTYNDTTIYDALRKEGINGRLAINNGKLMLKTHTLEGSKYTELPSKFFEDAINSIKIVLNKRVESYSKPRTDWEGTPIPVVNLDEDVYSVFLNIRNPFAFDYKGANINGKYKDKYPIEYINARQVAKAIKDGYDGVIYKNLYDPYLADNYGVFNPNQIKSATGNTGEFSTTNNEIYNYEIDNSNTETAKEFIDNMSGQQLRDELSTIKQESADYDLVNGIEEEQKHSDKAIPQEFTFADGTKVKAPFKPNEQQVDALNAMDAFMKSNETSMTLSGYAGTGKTSLMEMIAKKARQKGKEVLFCASTNKAAAVLNDRVSKAGFKATTVNKTFGIQVEVNKKGKSYNARDLVNALKDVEFPYGTTVIIDEASMINEENYKILNDIAKANGLKIIYVGDEAQLPPVNENKLSKVFRNGDGKVIRLTQVERTDDNAVLKEATDLRNGEKLSGESSFNSKGEGVAYILPEHQDAVNEVIEKYVKNLKKDPNYFRILAYTNKAVTSYNEQVRELLGYNTPTPQVGEPMMGYAQWGYVWTKQGGYYRFINSEAYKVEKVGKTYNKTLQLSSGKTYSMTTTPITLVDSMGHKDTFDYMDVKNDQHNREVATVLAKRVSDLWARWRVTPGKDAKSRITQEINKINEFLFINDAIEDLDAPKETWKNGQPPLLAKKVIDFGYAMTVHKSQGSTFTHVLLDDVDIIRGLRGKQADFDFTGEDVDLGKDEKDYDFDNVEFNETGEISFEDLDDSASPSPTETKVQTPSNPEEVNERQALEYVGVSRATDTVTIISNNVKKEGSPLHPEQSIKEDKTASKQQTQPTLAEQKLKQFRQNGIFYSGGANGSDLAWARELELLGLKVKHYYVRDYDTLSQDEKEGVERIYKDVVRKLGRRELPANSYAGKLVRRDYLQVAGANAVYAIGTFDRNGNVSGGTAYAVEYARMIGGKPIYFYDLDTHQWYSAIDSNAFTPMNSLPFLDERAAVIGTRDDKTKSGADALRPEGIQAIKNVIANTFGNALPQNTIPEQLIEHLKSQGINVLGREAMAEFLKTHNLKYLQQMVNNYYMPLDDAEEVEVLRHDLFGKFKDKSSFGCIGHTANYWYLCDYFGDSNYKVRAQIFIDGNEQFLNAFENAVRGKTFRDAEGFNRWFETFRTTQGKHYNGWANAKIRITTNGNAGVAISKLQGSQDANKGRSNGYGSVYNAEHEIETFTTPQGEVYGFVDKDGNIYLDETKISPNHPIHEYTHLWDRTVQQKNPKLWQRGVELMKQTSLWNEILNDANYGKLWQSMNLPQERLDNLIASEVHARFTGEGGEQLLNNLAKNKGQEGIIGKLKQWILDMWKEVKATFGNWSQEDLDKLTLRDFNHMTVRDFTEGVDIRKLADINSTEGTADDAERFNDNKQSQMVVSSDKTILSNDELKYWNEHGVGEMPRILTASEHTDPAFHVAEILRVLEGKQSITTWQRETLTGKDFAGMYLITKHDGLPMKKLLETKIPKLIHFSITGLGGTAYEPGVMKYNDLLDRIQEYIKQGLDPKCVTVRVDPIVPGVTKLSDVEEIVRRASEMDIKRIRFSILDAYPNTVTALERLGYNFETYYGKRADGKYNFYPKREHQNTITDFMLSLKDKYGVTLGTCAEPLVREGISKEGCLSVSAVNNMLGTHIEDKGTDNNGSRKLCSCYGGKVDALKYNAACASHCIYCYAKHENDKALQYYNEDGSLKDNVYTRTQESKKESDTSQQKQQVDKTLPSSDTKINVWAGTGENTELSNFAIRPFHHDFGDGSIGKDFQSVEQAFQYIKAQKFADTRSNDGTGRPNGRPISEDIMNTTNGAALRSLGRQIKELNVPAWDRASSAIMKDLIKESFEQNPNALQKLLETGNATLTHTQERGKWGKEFPKLLMEVREELRNEQQKNSLKSDTKENTTKKEGVETNVEQPSLPEATTKRISLPSYEFFNDYYDDTPVDAEWKVPYLKELDAQLSMENDEEKNQNIINQMNEVLQATSQKEYEEATGEAKKSKTEKALREYEKLIKQFDNLIDNDVELSAFEIRHVAELVGNALSDEITNIQTIDGYAKENYPFLNSSIDFKTASRKEIAKAIGVTNIIDKVKDLFEDKVAEYDNINLIMQNDLFTENWDAMMYLAADIFAFNEGFGIKKDYSNRGTYNTTNETDVDYDNFNDYSNDPDYERENGSKDEQEHWQVESRTIDVLNSMSALVRQGLHECYQLNKDGSKVMSKWGVAERVNPRTAVNSLLRWTQGARSLDEMIAKLSEKQLQNPWLSQLITRLSDKSGNETDFQSQFYGVLSKAFQSYSIVLLEDGKYHSMPVNNHPALTEILRSMEAQFKTGTLALVSSSGKINAKLVGNDHTIGADAEFNLHKAFAEIQGITNSLNKGKTLDEDMTKKVISNIMGVCNIFQVPVTEDIVANAIDEDNIKTFADSLYFMLKKDGLDKALAEQQKGNLKDYNPFTFKGEYSIDGALRKFLTPITDQLEDVAVSAFYDSGKMYQSYVIPSFWTRLMDNFHSDDKSFEEFMEEEYGSSEFFRTQEYHPGLVLGWKNTWLEQLADPSTRKLFDHKVELNFNKHNYMRNMSDTEYTLSLITEYCAESGSIFDDMAASWYRVPMQSNKPSSEFIKFVSYRDAEGRYKKSIVRELHRMFTQELMRIQTVNMRNRDKKDPNFIKNFDTNGRKFCFLPVLNSYLEDTAAAKAKRTYITNKEGVVDTASNNRLAELLQRKVKGEELSKDEETILGDLVEKVIMNSTEERVQSILDKWEKGGILKAAQKIKGIYPSDFEDNSKVSLKMLPKEQRKAAREEYTRKMVENFLWNDFFASKNILQLTIGDIAFYKDAEDLQKRLAQLHAPGVRANIRATDYKGNRVSDGNYRTFILKDFDTFKSNIIANIAEIFDRKIKAASTPEQKKVYRALKESLVGKDGAYTKINVTDAQGYSSMSSYRKKALLFGKWSKDAEALYEKIKSGDYHYTDLQQAFQPLKPFVYARIHKNIGVEGSPIQSMPVPFQAKNAEYLLIMADALLQGQETSRPNLLRAISRVMEDSEKLMPTKGIDTVQFESSIKSSLQGAMDISQFMEMEGGEEAAYNYMMNQIFKVKNDNNGDRIYDEYNTDTFVHQTSYDNYCLQQEVPEHFKNHSQAHGSQIRMITPSDLDYFTTDENGNQVDNYYEWTEPDGTKRRLKAEEFRKEYEETIAENIEEDLTTLATELHIPLEGKDSAELKKKRNVALSKILQEEILSSPRYGIDLLWACTIDKETGNFRIPKGDPIQAKRIEQLINSVIKSRINKQKIAGGPIVQVSNFGTSRQLHIRFNDKKGNLMPLEEEYNPSEHKGMSYKEYCEKYQGGIAYFEVFMPIWDNKLVEYFGNPDGSINMEAIEATNPELLKMVSYRIPTEDKYSSAPMKVVGFMPREAGDAIMLPYELTEIDDSDFDVDKRYVMRKDIPLEMKDVDEYTDALIAKGEEIYKEIFKEDAANGYVGRQVEALISKPYKFSKNSPFRKALFNEYQKMAFSAVAPKTGRAYRDNKIVDMTYAVLTNEMTADKILNPGGFEAPKKMGYMVTAYKKLADKGVSWEALKEESTDELKNESYTEKDLTFADTQVQFYKQNSAAASLIGVFAVNKVAHATLESNDMYLDATSICGENPFSIAGFEFGGLMQVDPRYDQEGNFVGKTLGSLVSASADAVKDPILNLMNINMSTAGMLNTMLRLGQANGNKGAMTFEKAALFLSQDIIGRMLEQFNKENLDNYVSLTSVIESWLMKYRKKYGIEETSTINTEPLTEEELIEGLTNHEHEATDYKVLIAFQKLMALTEAMRKPTYVTRLNSISSAVGPLIIDNLIAEHKMNSFLNANMGEAGSPFCKADGTPVDKNTVLDNHPILKGFSKAADIASILFSDMPAGSTGFKNLMNVLARQAPDIADKMYNDKKLFDTLSNFYQSYLLVQSGVVDTSKMKDIITEFPKEIKSLKEKYPDNALLKAIVMKFSKKSQNPYLQINITGMDEREKEALRSAWIDLHKVDPELSKKLFDYSFFRAGIGFSPKTFMALVPSYVKTKLKSEDGTTSYLDTYRKFPKVVPELVINQFIRNNWDNNTLVPWRGGKDSKYAVDLEKGTLKAYTKEDMIALANTSYMKTKIGGKTYLWHLVSKGDTMLFEKVEPLGNNGEYLEMSTSSIKSPLEATEEVAKEEAKDDTASDPQESMADMAATSSQEVDNTTENYTPVITETETVNKVSEMVDLIMKQNPRHNQETALQKYREMKETPRQYRRFLQNIFKHKGLNLSEEEAIKEFEKYC